MNRRSSIENGNHEAAIVEAGAKTGMAGAAEAEHSYTIGAINLREVPGLGLVPARFPAGLDWRAYVRNQQDSDLAGDGAAHLRFDQGIPGPSPARRSGV